MKRILLVLLAFSALTACSKKSVHSGTDGNLVGTWHLDELRGDPGDGSGQWMPVDSKRTVTFGANGSYHDTGRPEYNRYKKEGDEIILSNSNETYHLSILELTSGSLRYYLQGPFCGGPAGEKWTKQ